MSRDTAQAISWIAPSITPLTNLNSGFRVYEVDSNVSFSLITSNKYVVLISVDFARVDLRRSRRPYVSTPVFESILLMPVDSKADAISYFASI